MRVAAIDIGTVSSRLLIADADADGVHPLVRRSAITDLGEGVDATGRLSEDAIDRTVEQVRAYRRLVDEASCDTVVAIATSASRDASNARVFVDRLRDVGVELSVIEGSREAELSFLGAANDFRGERILFCDIGGGSTELAYGAVGGASDALVPEVALEAFRSFDIGARRTTERFLRCDPPSPEELSAARRWAEDVLSPFFEGRAIRAQRLVAVAGTPTSVVAVRDGLVPYDSSRVHKACVSHEEFSAVAARMRSLPLAQRAAVPGIQPKRAGIFPAGALILDVVMGLAGVSSFTASESDILMGIVLDAARAAGE